MKTDTCVGQRSVRKGFGGGALAVSMLAGSLASAQAADLFTITATGLPGTYTAGNKSLPDLVDSLIKAQGTFAPFIADAFTANLNYAGVANAITFSANAAGTSASLIIPSTGLNKSFTGADRAAVESQIEDFIKNDGSGEYAKFLKAMNAQSLVAVSDGNPNSTTAFAAAQTYGHYGMSFAETKEEKEASKEAAGRAGFGIIADVGSFDANGVKGKTYSLPLFARFKLTQRVGLDFDIPLSYVEIEGSKAFGVGLGIGIPVKVVLRSNDSPWYWQLTPFGGANVAVSKDLVAGGLLANGGLNSLVTYDFGPCALSMGNHISMHEGIPLTIETYRFDPGVSQYITKNGLKLDIPFGRRWIFDIYGVHTKFLNPAAIEQYVTVGGEIGYRMLGKPDAVKKKNGYVKLGVYADVGKNFTSAHAQFGTGWKF